MLRMVLPLLFAASFSVTGALAQEGVSTLYAVPEVYPVAGGLMVVMLDGRTIALEHVEAGQSEVRKAAIKVFGEPEDRGRMQECGAGPMDYLRFEQGLDLYFQDDVLVGWFIPEGSSMTTFDGIGSGSSIAMVREKQPNMVIEETSLGFEFWGDDLFGVVTGSANVDTVVVLWSGVSCIFR